MAKLFTIHNFAFWGFVALFVMAAIRGNDDQAAIYLVGFTLAYLIENRRG